MAWWIDKMLHIYPICWFEIDKKGSYIGTSWCNMYISSWFYLMTINKSLKYSSEASISRDHFDLHHLCNTVKRVGFQQWSREKVGYIVHGMCILLCKCFDYPAKKNVSDEGKWAKVLAKVIGDKFYLVQWEDYNPIRPFESRLDSKDPNLSAVYQLACRSRGERQGG